MDTNKVYTGDNVAVLSTFPDACIDLTVTSPPYDDMDADFNPISKGGLRTYNGYSWDFKALAQQLYRVTKPGGVVVWVVGDKTINGSETGASFRQALGFMDVGFLLHDTMIYMKSGPSYPSQDKYYQVFEYMFILLKGSIKTYNPIRDRENRWFGEKWSKVRSRRDADGKLKRVIWSSDEGEKTGTRFNIWQYAVGAGYCGDEIAHAHPAIFPEALARDHILSWSNPGDIVLDPFAGSGTTLKMAKLLDRRYIGIELSGEYVEKIIKPRLAATNTPLPGLAARIEAQPKPKQGTF